MAHFGYRLYAEARNAQTAKSGRSHAPRATEAPRQDHCRTPNERRHPRTELRALDILGADTHWSKSQIQKRYRSLVKNLHPDLNGGNRAYEMRFRDVIWAWERIKESHSFAD